MSFPTRKSLHSVKPGRILGVVPYAHALHGSMVAGTRYGFTLNHAKNRARKLNRELSGL